MFTDYEVSTLGAVRPLYTHVAKPRTGTRNGYARVRLQGACMLWHWRPVHVLVLETFVCFRPTPRHHGAHGPDRSKTNNRLDNLRWATPEENERDKRAHGTHSKGGSRTPSHPNTVRAILARAARGQNFTQIGNRFGLHRSSVARIVDGKRRSEITQASIRKLLQEGARSAHELDRALRRTFEPPPAGTRFG
jgi:hypothetical protein